MKSLSATLSSFKEDPAVSVRQSSGVDHSPKDPDIWPPPTPLESVR